MIWEAGIGGGDACLAAGTGPAASHRREVGDSRLGV